MLNMVSGHKDYLFHRLLAQELPYSSFRFDFRGNGESTGEPGYANMKVSWIEQREKEPIIDLLSLFYDRKM